MCGRSVVRVMPGFAPLGAMFENPFSQGSLEADVVAGFFGFDPLVFQDFLAFGLELAIERRILDQIISAGRICRIARHKPHSCLRIRLISSIGGGKDNWKTRHRLTCTG